MRVLLLVLLPASSFFLEGQAHATTPSSVSVTTVSHGLRLTLVVPQHTYPRNALVKATVLVQNVSDAAIATRLGPWCGPDINPAIEVSNRQGQLMPQLPSVIYDNPGCKRITGQPLIPHRSVRQQEVAVVSGTYIRAVVHWGHYLRRYFGTPRIHLHVTTGPVLTATIHTSRVGPYATVQRPSGARGPLYFVESARCGSPSNPQQTVLNLIWSPVLSNRVYSGCPGAQDWHSLAGYLNYPVAAIDWAQP